MSATCSLPILSHPLKPDRWPYNSSDEVLGVPKCSSLCNGHFSVMASKCDTSSLTHAHLVFTISVNGPTSLLTAQAGEISESLSISPSPSPNATLSTFTSFPQLTQTNTFPESSLSPKGSNSDIHLPIHFLLSHNQHSCDFLHYFHSDNHSCLLTHRSLLWSSLHSSASKTFLESKVFFCSLCQKLALVPYGL